MRTNTWLWAAFSLAFFMIGGFIELAPGVKEPTSLWAAVEELLRGDYYCTTSEMVGKIAVHALIRALPALLLGWAVHALLLVVMSIFNHCELHRDV
jgi:hypothetical protein